MSNRYLIDCDNPDAGIGHSMGILNRAIKIAMRNDLLLAYSENQLVKSTENSWKWKVRQNLRALRGKKRDETHNIGNDLNLLLNPKKCLAPREEIEKRIKSGELKTIEIPLFELHIPSNEQLDDVVYKQIDEFINLHSEPNLVFKIRNNRFGDYEYASSRQWFLKAYETAREQYPLPLQYDSQKLNIAIHIRRGDLLPGRQFSDLSSRMLPDSWYLNIIESISQVATKPLLIHIFSEGRNGQYISELGNPFSWREFFRYAPYDVTEHIDESFIEAFHCLMNADILIGSKSGMTHLAGMLGNQIKIAPTMWHSYRGANKVIEIGGPPGQLDQESIKDQLKQYL